MRRVRDGPRRPALLRAAIAGECSCCAPCLLPAGSACCALRLPAAGMASSEPPQHNAFASRRLRRFVCHMRHTPVVAAAAAETVPFDKYSDLLAELERQCGGQTHTVLDHAPDGSPLVLVKCGGQKLPPVFISAGAHSPEQAGVTAAVQLISEMRTEHTVYILPCRDPVGLNGFQAALNLGLGAAALSEPLESIDAAASLLRSRGEVIYDEGGRLIALLGDYAYTIRSGNSTSMISSGDPTLTSGPVHEALMGRRIYWPTNYKATSDSTGQEGVVEGSGPLTRAYTQFGTTDDILHINRFHDTPWAPAEVRCARTVMAQVQPRLVIDLHEVCATLRCVWN